MLSKYFAHVVNGEILAVNIKRGSVWNGKKLGLMSPDETYAIVGLYPMIGTRPTPGENQTVSGPTPQWDADAKVVRKIYIVSDIPAEVIAVKESAEAKSKLVEIDRKSVRSIRAFLIAKFGDDELMSDFLKTHETNAIAERSKVI